MLFLGLGLVDAVPDANTIWTVREGIKLDNVRSPNASLIGFTVPRSLILLAMTLHPCLGMGLSAAYYIGRVAQYRGLGEEHRDEPFVWIALCRWLCIARRVGLLET
jgi:hypothetical protein